MYRLLECDFMLLFCNYHSGKRFTDTKFTIWKKIYIVIFFTNRYHVNQPKLFVCNLCLYTKQNKGIRYINKHKYQGLIKSMKLSSAGRVSKMLAAFTEWGCTKGAFSHWRTILVSCVKKRCRQWFLYVQKSSTNWSLIKTFKTIVFSINFDDFNLRLHLF